MHKRRQSIVQSRIINKNTSFRYRFVLLLCIITVIFTAAYIAAVIVLPGNMTLIEGQEYKFNLHFPFKVGICADKDGILRLNGKQLGLTFTDFNLYTPVALQSSKIGNYNLQLKLYGILPLRTMRVDVLPNKKVVPCGNTVGVKIQTKGILVIALSDVEDQNGKKYEPAKEAGLKVGDTILEANEKVMHSIEDLIHVVESSQGKPISIKYQRGSNTYQANIKPAKSSEDKKYHLGIWVRDSTAGIGTMTFYDSSVMMYGALGHGITDMDTGSLLSVEGGEILHSSILSIKKGQRGKPGELKGIFLENNDKLGNVEANTEFGIYGKIFEESLVRNYEPVQVATRAQVKEGPATILANIEGDKVEEFKIEIQKVSRQNTTSSKGMIIRVLDERLLNETGGIVQGMSGSPILQEGRLVGAVTHVLVNDPTRGYGIFAEWMLQNINDKNNEGLQRAG